MLSQLRESDLPVGDVSRTLGSSSGLLELLPIYQPSVEYIGSNSLKLEFNSVTPRPTDSTREFENLSDETEELCYSSFFLDLCNTYLEFFSLP